MHKVLNNNSPTYLAHFFISHQSHYTNSGITSTCQGQDLPYLKLACPSLERPSGTLCLTNVICTNICLRITFRQIWTDLFESHVCLRCFCTRVALCETALINCLFVFIRSVCGIVVINCVCCLARTGC